MSLDPENLLEVDRIEEVIEAAGPVQPIILIPYRSKIIPRLLMGALILVLPLGAVGLYHQLVGERLRAQALEARHQLERMEEKRRLEADQANPIRNESQVASTAPSEPLVLAQVEDQPAPVAERTGSATPQSRLAEPPRPPLESRPLTSPEVDPPAPAAILPDPDAPGKRSDRPEANPPGKSSSVAKAEPPGEPTARPEGEPAAAPAPPIADSSPTPAAPFAVQAESPLPSKEETLRQIREEAAGKEVELSRQQDEKETEALRLHYEERVRFREELLLILDRLGGRAGAAIDELSARIKYEFTPEMFVRARRMWNLSGRPLAYRVRLLRLLDLPEPVILNFISDDLFAHLRTPTGPKNSNEIRVKSARLLLNCDLPPVEQLRRPPPAGGRGGPSETRPTGIPPSKSAPRPR